MKFSLALVEKRSSSFTPSPEKPFPQFRRKSPQASLERSWKDTLKNDKQPSFGHTHGGFENLLERLSAIESRCVSDSVTRNPVTVTVAYQVIPGRETEFHSWGWAVLRARAREPGFLGGGVLVDGEAEWHVVYRFDSESSALAWEYSASWAQWAAKAQGLARETGRHSVQGSRVWFDSQTGSRTDLQAGLPPAAPVPAPPRPPAKWKMWFVNMSAVFPPVLIFNLTILPFLGGVNALIRTLLLCLAVTALVTWILMPRLQRFFKKWLYPPLQALRGRHKRRTA